ncbi:MAG: carbamoyltransferase HypF [bacterium]
MKDYYRNRIRLNGIVQGVGFRPFVYRLARECGLSGFVNNNSDGVLIEVEGAPERLSAFRQRLQVEAPPLARIVEMRFEEIKPQGQDGFTIRTSQRDSTPSTLISPDISICSDCLRELFDPTERRYRYPFINCTNCGPRYTIVRGIPYDRPLTSMSIFPMCPECSREYDDPTNRRFHAQPNACPECGPQVSLYDTDGQVVSTSDALAETIRLLHAGRIVAIRGLGGFHLAVNALNDAAVRELRRRKGRAEKPFAMMAPDLRSIEKFCQVSANEAGVLQSSRRPIVLLQAHPGNGIAPTVAPNNSYLGFMLPYTPLHHLILRDHFDALVMTSGNHSEEPIAIGNREALERLTPLADYLLLHDREILQRCDDSIVRVTCGAARLIRRSRGFVPEPVFLSFSTRRRILACGAELKNTIALSRKNTVFLSQHIGDLDNPAALDFFENSVAHLQKILEITPEVIAYDLHPEYLSTKWALRQQGAGKIAVQHHHAHLASVLAENGVAEPTIGVILDGTGYGTDGTIWGGEVLVGDTHSFERFAWLAPVALPGGAAAIRQPWRMALSHLSAAYGAELLELQLPFMQYLSLEQMSIILQMIERKVNTPLTSSCGRLFDAIAAILNIRTEITYEAQAAVELEMTVDESEQECYHEAIPSAQVRGPLPVVPMIRAVVDDVRQGVANSRIAARFHQTVAQLFLQAAVSARNVTTINRVGLSGGVFQNVYFFNDLLRRLQAAGFEVLTHRQVPTNDGGLALGQLMIADSSLE